MNLVSKHPMKIRSDGRYEYDHVLTPEQLLNPIWKYFFPKDSIVRVNVEGVDFRQTTNYPIVFDKFNSGYRVSGIRVKNGFDETTALEFVVVNVFMDKSDFDYNETDAEVVMKIMEMGSAVEPNLTKWRQSK